MAVRLFLCWFVKLDSTYHCSRKYADAQKFFSQTISTEQDLKEVSFWEIYARFCRKRAIIDSGGEIDPHFPPEGCQERNCPKSFAGQLEATMAEILINIDPTRINEPKTLFATAIAEEEKNGTRWCQAKIYEALAGLCRKKCDPEGAAARLNKAIEAMEECGVEG